MIRIRDIKVPAGRRQGPALLDKISDILCIDKIYPDGSCPDFSYEILRRSVDARKCPEIFRVYTVALLIPDKDERKILDYFSSNRKDARVRKALDRIVTDPVAVYELPECAGMNSERSDRCKDGDRPVVVGAGPAGLFCALALARRSLRPVLIERGQNVENRKKAVETFWKTGELDPESNVQFGEGGAGTFSDGKLNTLTKDTLGRNSFVLRTFHEHGAPKDITIDAKPHIGTDILADVVKNIREEIIRCGGEVRFETKLTDIGFDDGRLTSVTVTDTKTGKSSVIRTGICVLCTGHSARDTFEMLFRKGIDMTPKSFAVGFRVIHPQELVNRWAYGMPDPEKYDLPPADYKVAREASNGRRVYSFCMCPGGYVVNASSEDARLCVNGMSRSGRSGKYANSAIIAAIDPVDFSQDVVEEGHPLAGMYYQRRLEEEAYRRGEGAIPWQPFAEFEHVSKTGKGEASSVPSKTEEPSPCPVEDFPFGDAVMGSVRHADLRGIFSEEIDEAITESMHGFGHSREGFDTKSLMLGIEARTSSPVRIERDASFQSNIKGLYPCGEGAGYAGGIMSAAVDGLKCAEQIIKTYDQSFE